MPANKSYVLDTSVYLTDANSIFKFGKNNIFVPLKVLEEIDKHKTRQDSVGANARHFIKTLDVLREKGSLEKGVKISEENGTLCVMSYSCLKDIVFPPDLDLRIPDHAIIATARAVQLSNKKTTLVSRDINMRVICDSIGIPAEDYISEEAIPSSDDLYAGFVVQSVDEQVIDRYYAGEEDIYIEKDEVNELWYPNQYVMLISNSNEKKVCISKI